MHRRRTLLLGLLGLSGSARVRSAALQGAEEPADRRSRIFFIQRDKVVSFAINTGLGSQVGTAEGEINGTTIVNSLFTPPPQATFTFDNRVLITDIDGEQII